MRQHLVKALLAAIGGALNGFLAGWSTASQYGSWLAALWCASWAVVGIALCWHHINRSLAEAPR